MNKEQQENSRQNTIILGKSKTRTLRKEELKKMLEVKGLSAKGMAKDMIKQALENGIATKETTDKVDEGWQGKAEGLLQLFWERGFIDAINIDKCMMNGR
jgi:hypothetical protein